MTMTSLLEHVGLNVSALQTSNVNGAGVNHTFIQTHNRVSPLLTYTIHVTQGRLSLQLHVANSYSSNPSLPHFPYPFLPSLYPCPSPIPTPFPSPSLSPSLPFSPKSSKESRERRDLPAGSEAKPQLKIEFGAFYM